MAHRGEERPAHPFGMLLNSFDRKPNSQTSAYGHVDERGKPLGLKVDTLPVLHAKLDKETLWIARFGRRSIDLLGEYCEAMFKDRELLP